MQIHSTYTTIGLALYMCSAYKNKMISILIKNSCENSYNLNLIVKNISDKRNSSYILLYVKTDELE